LRRSLALASIILVLVGVPLGVFVGTSSSSASPTLADPNTTIEVGVSIGGLHPGQARTAVQRLLGAGKVTSTQVHKRRGRGPVTLTIVRYPASQLVVVYGQAGTVPPYVLAVSTTSPRYHTAGSLRVGSTLAETRKTTGIACSAQPTGFACEGGLSFAKPVTSFVVQHNHVTEVIVGAGD
jgi:hypothetical protein